MTKKYIKLYFEQYQSNSYEHISGEEVLIFVTDPWNDNFRYQTLFHVSFVNEEGIRYYIGTVKIFTNKGYITREQVTLNDYFENLDNTFYSLGQSLDYYTRLKMHLSDSYEDTLDKIRDVATSQTILDELKANHWEAFSESLIRESTASSALKIINKKINTYYSFVFENILKNNVTQRCGFDFSEDPNLPFRINAIIGKNATGKTTYLSSLAEHLHSKERDDSKYYRVTPLEERHKRSMREENYLPNLGFTNYITVSFNAFDDFYQPENNKLDTLATLIDQVRYYYSLNEMDIVEKLKEEEYDNTFDKYINIANNIKTIGHKSESVYMSSDIKSYKYIGLRKDNIINTDYYLYMEMLNSLRMICIYDFYYEKSDKSCKIDFLEKFIYRVLYYGDKERAESFYGKIKAIYDEIRDNVGVNEKAITFDDSLIQDLQHIVKQLSSGQNITFYIYLNILANITESSLLLIDEPETHLHPNAISSFISFLYELLEEYLSYAIITTHSPLVIQEIPSSHIRVFKNIEGQHYADEISLETFGANISDIIYDVFFVSEDESNYQKKLIELCNNGMEYNEIVKLFKNKLNLDTKLFLRNLYKKRGV